MAIKHAYNNKLILLQGMKLKVGIHHESSINFDDSKFVYCWFSTKDNKIHLSIRQ